MPIDYADRRVECGHHWVTPMLSNLPGSHCCRLMTEHDIHRCSCGATVPRDAEVKT